MNTKKATIRVKVLNHWLIESFSGEAVLAAVDPKFAIALLMPDSSTMYRLKNSDISIPVSSVAFFLVDSIVNVFRESDVLNKEYDVTIIVKSIEGRDQFWIGVV